MSREAGQSFRNQRSAVRAQPPKNAICESPPHLSRESVQEFAALRRLQRISSKLSAWPHPQKKIVKVRHGRALYGASVDELSPEILQFRERTH
jgi:hypothetical protein